MLKRLLLWIRMIQPTVVDVLVERIRELEAEKTAREVRDRIRDLACEELERQLAYERKMRRDLEALLTFGGSR